MYLLAMNAHVVMYQGIASLMLCITSVLYNVRKDATLTRGRQ